MLRALALLVLLAPLASARAADRPHVYLVVVDGLDARLVTPTRMPRLFETLRREPARSSVFPAAHAVMPARTNPNHVSLLTGAYPQAHGITGNGYWSRTAGAAAQKLDSPDLIEVETLFTVVEETQPELVTLGVFAKDKLRRLFGAVPGRQHAPDELWTGGRAPDGEQGGDDQTMAAALARLERPEPDLVVVGLAGVDQAAHPHGPESPECERAVSAADAAIGALVDHLHSLGRWGRSVLIVTADHGFSGVAPTPETPYPLISLGRELLRARLTGVHLVDDGGVEHVYADALAADATAVGAAGTTLARVAEVAAATPGVGEILARLPVPGATDLAAAHPDWHVAHQRVGDLLLVASPGSQFVDPFDPDAAGLRGNHGGPETLTVPLIVTGGAPQITGAPSGAPAPSAVDVTPTIVRLLGLRLPHRTDGTEVPTELAGHVIAAVLSEPPSH